MRTTVILDPDVAAKLKAMARTRGISFNQALNEALRAGLSEPWRFRQRTQPMGLRPGFDLDKALRLGASLEDEGIIRKLEAGE